ncbi:leucyl/phenylalanyl-tRNA--protein transferase [Mizugakiibacter sediminis]|uniref:Leucyl/phenylalanyl-tRNA--protein transferase n=1 Tax=Mizugakiibacter sediminis TaxID=1475481 RepID=A0A0K8QQ44_9GAMM|nr:leucyl/phenylalanyl-tRNA--protein transferase [Mizugakiibacter sediminis]GAP67024.1 leucyl/phenylalanyl-tRNA--protein transferase [Mizugakiibacter sediminis]
MTRLPILDPQRPDAFPDPQQALREPNGLLAAGGDLSPQRLLHAYARGIFPWYGEGEPILWWSPDPRCVFRTDGVHVSRRLARFLRGSRWTLSADAEFEAVVGACGAPRARQSGTWITRSMHAAYVRLHALGHAHSVEVWDGGALVGGIYGVAVGRMFCGESMFSRADNGSKAALLALCRALHGWGFPLLDAQVTNPHLLRLGAIEMPRAEYLEALSRLAAMPGETGHWRSRFPLRRAAELAS